LRIDLPPTLTILLALLVPAGGAVAQPRLPTAPQIKVDRVDAAAPSDWRILVSALGPDGDSLKILESGVQVFLAEGKGPVRTTGADPIARFGTDGLAVKGFGGVLKEVGKADVTQATVFVVAAHAEIPREAAAALPGALAEAFAGLRADARASLIVYDDAVLTAWNPGGDAPSFTDVNDYQDCLGGLRATADRPEESGAPVRCGRLFPAPASLAALAKTGLPAPQGLFPRLLGIEEGGDALSWAEARGHTRIDRADEAYVRDRYAVGAIEAALRMLVSGSPASSLRSIVLFSDGRDGYLRFADAAGDKAAARCRSEAGECAGKAGGRTGEGGSAYDPEGASKACSRAVLECSIPRVSEALARREAAVRDVLVDLVRLARAAGVRITTVALPGTDDVGAARLQSLAIRTGGTYRPALATNQLKAAAGAVAAEFQRQAVIRPGTSLESGRDYVVVVTAGDLKSPPFRFVAGGGTWLGAGAWSRARAAAIAKLGHGWGPPVLWIVAILAAVAVLGLALALGKGVKALVGKIGAPPKPKRPTTPKMPTVKRPGT
jgi:hypothetical protein